MNILERIECDNFIFIKSWLNIMIEFLIRFDYKFN